MDVRSHRHFTVEYNSDISSTETGDNVAIADLDISNVVFRLIFCSWRIYKSDIFFFVYFEKICVRPHTDFTDAIILFNNDSFECTSDNTKFTYSSV